MGERCRIFRHMKWNQPLNSHYRYPATILLLISAVFINSCSAQGFVRGGREDVDIGGSRSSRQPCLPEKYLIPLRAAFQKLIPTFNSHSLVIQLRTDARIQMGPEDSKLVPFLRAYYPTVVKKLKATTPPNKLTQSAMLLYFNTEYSHFLAQAGVPLSCLSYFLGVADVKEAMQLQQLSQNLQKRFRIESEDHDHKPIFGKGVTGQEIVKSLKIKPKAAFTPSEYLRDRTRDQAICQEILLYLKDDSILIKLPISNLEMRSMYIPSFKSPLQLGQVEVPYEIARYIAIGLNCLDRTEEKRNFIEKVLDWASTKLIPQIIQSPTCLHGFGGILPFMASIQEYEDTLDQHETSLQNATLAASQLSNVSSTSSPMSTTTESLSSNVIHVRKRRSIENTNQHNQKRKKKQHSQHHMRIPLHLKNPPAGRNQKPTNFNKMKYDDELFHLYNKLNKHFLNNGLKIDRLDIIKLPKHSKAGGSRFPPVIFHSTTTRPTTTKIRVTKKRPTTTTTTRRTTTTTTTTTKPSPYIAPPFPVAPISNVRVIGEVRLDENRLNKPVSVVVHGNKFNAHLNVIPKGMVHNTRGEVIHFEDNPFKKDPHQVGPQFHHGRHLHPRDPDKVRPLHLRKHLLYKQFANDRQPHNVVDKILNDGVETIANFAHSLVPAIFVDRRPKKLPKMHTFNDISPEVMSYIQEKGAGQRGQRLPQQEPPPVRMVERPSKTKGRRLSSIDRGLENLIKTDEEFPRRV
ncbi:unnamed protein product [Orchesella dallaii]|uniref:Uncharacterized protein n=1 Tax=Orchesella dallaii TaxID=48710 RepID=A0ABP1PTT7_9HEXA